MEGRKERVSTWEARMHEGLLKRGNTQEWVVTLIHLDKSILNPKNTYNGTACKYEGWHLSAVTQITVQQVRCGSETHLGRDVGLGRGCQLIGNKRLMLVS